MDESLQTVNGRRVLSMQRRFAHPPAKVWRALTEPAQISSWYPFPVVELELEPGGRIRFDGGDGSTFGGVVTELDPPRVFAFSEEDDLVRFELRPDGAGCLLLFAHIFDDRPGVEKVIEGWTRCFTDLDATAEAG